MLIPICRLIMLLVAAFSWAPMIAAPLSENSTGPALPRGYPVSVGDSGNVVWVESNYHWGDQHNPEFFHTFWDSSTGAQTKLDLPPGFSASTAAKLEAGMAFLGERPAKQQVDNLPQTVVLYTLQGGAMSVDLPLRRTSSRLIVLKDQSILIIGGALPANNHRSNAIEHIFLTNGTLEVERLPDMPNEVSRGYSLVALNDGRAMILGGSNEPYTGCDFCVSDTFFLEPKSKTWSKGPRMLEPRSDAAATLLSDGSVLVVGGWSPEHGWNNQEASRSTERWMPENNRFVADTPLPIGVARPQLTWVAGQQYKQLLLMGGMSRAWTGNDDILDYDVASGIWHAAGKNIPGTVNHQTGALVAGSLASNGQIMLWTYMSDSPKNNPSYKVLNISVAGKLRTSTNLVVALPRGIASPSDYHSNISADFLLSEATSPARVTNAAWWISQGADVDTRNIDGWTVLMLANRYWDIKLIQSLIDNGADINAKNKDGATDLMLAIQSHRTDVVQALLSKHADINSKDGNGKTALIIASEVSHLDAVKMMLEKGADVNAKASDGMTALMFASSNGRLDVVQTLLAKGADANARTNNGKTALMFASSSGQLDVIQALIARNVDINAHDNQGVAAVDMTPKERLAVRNLLIKAGAVTASKNPNLQGVWKGQLGTQEVTACFQLDERDFFRLGAYYYAKYRQPIKLEYDSDTVRADSSLVLHEIKGVWDVSILGNDGLAGTWSYQGKQYPIRLVRMPISNNDELETPCASAEFNDSRKIKPQFIFTKATVNGSPYRAVTDKNTKGIASFELIGSGTVVESVNQQLRTDLLAETDEAFDCVKNVLGQFGENGEYSSTTTPIFITKHWLSAAVSREEDCGGAHPNSDTSYRLWNLETGKPADIWTWFDKNGAQQDNGYFVAAPKLANMLESLWPKSVGGADHDCDVAAGMASWNIHPDATGLIFSAELPHVIQACAQDVHVPYSRLIPMLNAQGKAAVASISADLARQRTLGK